MYAIPQLMAVPVLTGVGMTTFEWPALGAFLAWMLIAAFVGTGLGALRRMTSPPPRVITPCTQQARPIAASAHANADRGHLKAA